MFFFFSSRRRHTRSYGDWSSDVCSSDLRSSVRRTTWGVSTGSPATAAAPTSDSPPSVAGYTSRPPRTNVPSAATAKIGRASCRERVEQSGDEKERKKNTLVRDVYVPSVF